MELDDLKNKLIKEKKMNSNTDDYSFEQIKTKVTNFDKETKRNLIIETLIATFAFIAVITLIINGDNIYPGVIDSLMPELAKNITPKINALMYSSMILMAVYCVLVTIKLHLSHKTDESLNWTLTSRLDSEIKKLEQQNKLWSNAHLWSVIPSAVIGVLFFWGLQISLLDTWFPGLYLSLYLVFIALFSYGGILMKNHMTGNRIQPLLDQLHDIKNQLNCTNT